ncbi:MAG: Eco29kI family restriction endonuclease [Planctomycetaceae bacterium]|jgi:hypothetical protein
MSPEETYNPLDKRHLAESIRNAMLQRPVHGLDQIENFDGAGIYAIYYHGDFDLYRPISARNQAGTAALPIYVGKAIPAGNRRGLLDPRAKVGDPLWKRLKEHAESIRLSENLQIAHFDCRYLVVDDIWIPLGESLLIQTFKPLWNVALDGFGNHDPGSGRRGQKQSPWDTLHPGRPWTLKQAPGEKPVAQLRQELRLIIERNLV